MIFIILGTISEDEEQFINDIFKKLNVKMYNISFSMLKTHFDAEEAVSQTFLKIIEHIEKIANLPCPEIEPYCVIILKNETINIIRKRKKTIIIDDLDYIYKDNDNNIVEEEFIKSANKERLIFSVNKLSDEEKTLIYLRFVNDMSFKVIAGLLDITEEAAKKRSQRILKKIRLYYEGGDESVQSY